MESSSYAQVVSAGVPEQPSRQAHQLQQAGKHQPFNVSASGNRKITASTSVTAAGCRVKILGVCRIWGTLKSTRTSAILKKLAAHGDQLFVKRKTATKDGRCERWWFVLKEEETLLQQLEDEWEKIQIQTQWKLEHCYRLEAARSAVDQISTISEPHHPLPNNDTNVEPSPL